MIMKRFWILVVVTTMIIGSVSAQHRGHGHNRGDGHNRHNHQTEYYCASTEQMRKVMQVLENQSFDDKRMEVAELCVILGDFCVRDLATIAEVFSFDDNRLKFLQFAYPYCADPENYYSLRKSFSFSSNFDKLMESVQPRRR